jgi:hypothetical protein
MTTVVEPKNVVTITFGDAAENHAGMEMIGTLGPKGSGFDHADLVTIAEGLSNRGIRCEIHEIPGIKSVSGDYLANSAYVLVARNAVGVLHGDTKPLYKEMVTLDMDTKALMRGRVVNKHARHNVCFADEGHGPDYAAGKGTVVPYDSVPLLQGVKRVLPDLFGSKAADLKGELNYYFDIKKCGIGFHGDSERRKVVALRLGASMPLYFQWYFDHERIGARVEIELNDGDMYVMSEKAVGTDWKSSTVFTLRHATGCAKYTD